MYSLTTYRSILRSESYNEIYAWNQSCTRLPGSFMTFGASVVLAVMQKGHEQGEWRSLILLFTIEKTVALFSGRIPNVPDTGSVSYFYELRLLVSSAARICRSYMNAIYIDRAMRWRLNEVENARDVHWRVTSLF